MPYAIELSKENFKFSCTHFTIFSAEDAERLHGHNYQARARLEFDDVRGDLGMAFDFNLVKKEIKAICDVFDEYVLIPERSPYVSIARAAGQVEVRFAKRFYSFPETDVRFLPIANITVEELARHFAETLAGRVAALVELRAIAVSIEETRGQSVSYELKTR